MDVRRTLETRKETLGRSHKRAAAFRSVEICVVAIVIGAAALLVTSNELWMLSLISLSLFVVLYPVARGILMVYTVAILSLSQWVNSSPIDLGVANVYVTDAVILLLGWGAVATGLSWIRGIRPTIFDTASIRRILLILALFAIYGLFSAFYGLAVMGYSYDNALGDFRRFSFYALAMAVPLMLTLGDRQLRSLDRAVLVSGILVLMLGLYRVATGTGVREDIDSATGYVGLRLLNPDEITTLSLLLALLVLRVRTPRSSIERIASLAAFWITVPLLFISGYRLSAFLAVAAPVLALLLFAWVKRERVWVTARWLGAGALAAAAAAASAPFLFAERFDRVLLDLTVRMQTGVVQGGWRRYTWAQAMREFADSPILGKGFGHRLVFPFRTSDGSFRYIDSSAHNVFLSILYQMGIIGFVLFVALHGLFCWHVLKRIRYVRPELQVLVTALFAGYLCNMAGSFLQSPGISRYVYTYLLMGFLLHLVHLGSDRLYEQPEG